MVTLRKDGRVEEFVHLRRVKVEERGKRQKSKKNDKKSNKEEQSGVQVTFVEAWPCTRLFLGWKN